MVNEQFPYNDKPLLGGEAYLSISGSTYAFGEATINIDRAAVAASRAGAWSDYKRAGKVDVSGTLKRLYVDGSIFNALLGSSGTSIGSVAHFSMVISGSHDGHGFTFTVNNAFFTSGEFTCGSSDSFVEETHNWTVRDADQDFSLVWA